MFRLFLALKNFVWIITLLALIVGIGGSLFVSQIVAESLTTVNLSNNAQKSHHSQMSVNENFLYVLWQDDTSKQGDIFFSRSTNEGISFEPVINLSNNTGDSAFPRIVVSENKVYATWYDYTPGLSDIFFSKSDDGGLTFETINLSKNAGVSFNPWIAAIENNVFVVWNDDTDPTKILQRNATIQDFSYDVSSGNFEIYIATSHDSGTTFEITNLSNSPENSVDTRLAVSGNDVYVVWNEKKPTRDIFLAASNDLGKSFSQPINVSNSEYASNNAGIQAFEENVHLIWREKNPESTYISYAKSENKGASFGTPINLSKGSFAPKLTRDTQMAVTENNVFVVWYDNSPNSSGVFFVRSIDGGNSFSEPKNLSGKAKEVKYAQIVIQEKDVYVIWNDNRLGNSQVFLRQSHDEGKTFGSIENLSSDDNSSNLFVLGPQIALSEENFFINYEKVYPVGSDLFLKGFSQNKKSQPGTLSLYTLNESVQVEMEMSEEKLEFEKPIMFTLKFIEPATGQQLENVNYSFKIVDMAGKEVLNRLNQHSSDGHDTQTVTFLETGPMTIIIDVEGLGVEQPYNTKYSGMASAVITVVPEFSVAVLVFGLAIIAIVLLGKFKYFLLPKQNTCLHTN